MSDEVEENASKDILSAMREVEAIRKMLEKKHNLMFDTRIGLSGYVDKPSFFLEISNVKDWTAHTKTGLDLPYVTVQGSICDSLNDVYAKFLECYWKDVEREVSPDLREWHDQKCVAFSRDEFVLSASAMGLM